jgi:hypothetical protein
VSRSWASREANAPGTRIFIADLFELRRERVKALFDQALDVIEDAMKARKFATSGDEDVRALFNEELAVASAIPEVAAVMTATFASSFPITVLLSYLVGC